MLRAGNEENFDNKWTEYYDSAINKKIKVGMYWIVKGNSAEDAKRHVLNATDFIQNKIKNKALDYKFYFEIKTPNAFKDISKINEYCSELGDYCGIKLSPTEFNNYFKDKLDQVPNVKRFWIDSYDTTFDGKNIGKISLVNTNEDVSLGKTFKVIKENKKQ